MWFGITVHFELGCDIAEFRKYYETVQENPSGIETMLIKQNPEHPIIWREGPEIINHAIWQLTSTDIKFL